MSYQHETIEPTLKMAGGDLLVYSKNGMIVSERKSDSQFKQVISVSFETETKALAINLVYRSPNSTAENNEQLNKFI